MRVGSRGRSIGWAGACLLALALAAALASCGGAKEAAATAKAGTQVVSTAPAKTAAPERAERAVRTNTQDATLIGGRCSAQLGGLLAGMAKLRTALVAGLAYEQYVSEVKAIRDAYDELPVERLALGCLRAAGTAGEKALNRYIAAGNEWTDCVEVPSCEAASIETPLQANWKQASEYLSRAQRGLRRHASG